MNGSTTIVFDPNFIEESEDYNRHAYQWLATPLQANSHTFLPKTFPFVVCCVLFYVCLLLEAIAVLGWRPFLLVLQTLQILVL